MGYVREVMGNTDMMDRGTEIEIVDLPSARTGEVKKVAGWVIAHGVSCASSLQASTQQNPVFCTNQLV